MKKIITICLLMAATFIANAQEKPSKEETIAYLDKALKSPIGYNTYNTKENVRVVVNVIELCSFMEKEIDFKNKIKFSNINWADMKEISTCTTAVCDSSYTDELVQITINFSSKIKVECPNFKIRYMNEIWFAVLRSKLESFKKGLIRLSEIAKEENKDPFDK